MEKHGDTVFWMKDSKKILQRILEFPQGGTKAGLGLTAKFSREFQREAQEEMLRDGDNKSVWQGYGRGLVVDKQD